MPLEQRKLNTTPPLADSVMDVVRAQFAAWGHYPSPENWRGLEAIARTFQEMADGETKQVTYLSSEPPGAGKTTTLIECLVQLAINPKYRRVGAVIFLNTLDAIETLVTELLGRGVSKDQIAIEIGAGEENDRLRAMGRGEFRTVTKGARMGDVVWKSEHEKAQILICTQQKLLAVVRAGRRDFEKFWRCFPVAHYPGKPRRVRIWDEALLPAESIVLPRQEIEEHVTLLKTSGQEEAADTLREWYDQLAAGDVDGLPVEFFERLRFTKRLPELLDDDLPFNKLPLTDVKVRGDYDGLTLIHYRDLLPENFAPLLVTDASGSLRLLYKAWEHGRGGLRMLPSGEKAYRNLTIHHWDEAAGKLPHNRSWARKKIAKAAVGVLGQVPEGDPVLFVVRKPLKPSQNMQRDIVREAKAAGFSTAEIERRMRFVTWGKHLGTNQFHTIKHVVLVGVLQTRLSVTEADLRAAGRMSPDMGLEEKTIRSSRLAEAAHHIYQAAGRGALRKMESGDCPRGCTLWAVFSTYGPMGIPRGILERCFPGARIEEWEPFGVQLRTARLNSPNREKLADALVARLGEREWVEIERRDLLADGFSDTMVHRYLTGEWELLQRFLLKERGVELTRRESAGKRRGNRWLVYTLRRETRPTSGS